MLSVVFASLGRFVYRRRVPVVLAWVLLLGVGLGIGGQVFGRLGTASIRRGTSVSRVVPVTRDSSGDAMTAGGNPYGDGLAAHRTAQATAALLGLAEQPEPMPSLDIAPTVTFGANV